MTTNSISQFRKISTLKKLIKSSKEVFKTKIND